MEQAQTDRVASSLMLDEIKASGRPVVVSFSGGKDSTAMCIWIIKNKVPETNPVHWVFADTKWEHPSVYQYIQHINKTLLGGDLNYLSQERYPNGMIDIVKHRGRFPASNARFCTSDLKIVPIRNFIREIAEQHAPLKPINCVGIRAAESRSRSKLLEWELGTNLERTQNKRGLCDTWRPGISWLIEDVVRIHNDAGIEPCGLYLKDKNYSKRVGCYPCIFAHKRDIRIMAEEWPERIDQIRELENEVNQARKERCDIDGGDIESKDYRPVSFFMSKDYHRTGDFTMPIDEVVSWSKTARGGKQFELELFAPTEEERGCEMWGLCELPDSPEQEAIQAANVLKDALKSE